MARTKPPAPHQANLTAQQRVDAAARVARRRIAIRRAATMITAEAAAALRVKEHGARASSESEEGEETEPEEDTFSRPEPEHVIKLSAQPCGNGSRFQWRGRLRGGGADVYLECAWVRKNFKPYVRPRPNSA